MSEDNALGNLTSWPNNPAAQVKHNAADQLTQDAANTYSYDNEGNQVTKRNRTTGDTTTYAWNAAHQLTKITNPDGSSVAYGYGPLGRRLTATDSVTGKKVFVWAGGNLRATLDTTGSLVNRNTATPDLNGTLAVTTLTGTTYPLKDGLGSTTATTNGSGTVTSTTAYTAYGIPTITSGSATGVGAIAGYTGHQTDPGGLIYARARYYNPQTGTFLSEDPVTAVNPYGYAVGSPTNFADLDGEISGPRKFAAASCLSLSIYAGGFALAKTPEAARQATEAATKCAESIGDEDKKQGELQELEDVAEEVANAEAATPAEVEAAAQESIVESLAEVRIIAIEYDVAEEGLEAG